MAAPRSHGATSESKTATPSPWVARFAAMVERGGHVLDVAAGGGRHSRLFLDRGNQVTAVDVDTTGLRELPRSDRLHVVEADLEGASWPFSGAHFAAVVVTNYLWRPLFEPLAAAVAPGGILIYETLAHGNERFGKPSNPAYLLGPGELQQAFAPTLEILACEQAEVLAPRAAVVQRLCAVRRSTVSA